MFQNPDDVTVLVAVVGVIFAIISPVVLAAIQLWQQNKHLAADRRRSQAEFLIKTFDDLWKIYTETKSTGVAWIHFRTKALSINDPEIYNIINSPRTSSNESELFLNILKRIGTLIGELHEK